MNTKTFRFILFSLLVVFASCKKTTDNGPSPVPYVNVNVNIDMSKFPYNALLVSGGYVYLVNVGNKGIIVLLDQTGVYRAFDRTCPYHVTSSCGVVIMSSDGSDIVCGTYNSNNQLNACCASVYNLDGSVLHGPTTFSLKAYKVTQSGTMLNITN